MAKKIFATSEEKFVKAVVLYPGSGSVLFYDAAATAEKVPAADLENLFNKGLILINVSGVIYTPIMFKKESTYYSVSVVTAGESALALTTYKSDALPSE